ncbi:hypothetical protein J3R82DRAFT_10511 [Butyriboletus roseoflavus]|nr:hypothetical protein J3R82DRAFT_10511 [Butyriboletus roseoflavus]
MHVPTEHPPWRGYVARKGVLAPERREAKEGRENGWSREMPDSGAVELPSGWLQRARVGLSSSPPPLSHDQASLSTYKSATLPWGHSLFSFSPPVTGSRDMLTFFKSVNPTPKQPMPLVAGEKRDDAPTHTTDIAIESAPVQDALASTGSAFDPPMQLTDEPEARVSSASVPTVDSALTIHGLQSDGAPPVQSRSIPLPDSPNHAASLVPPSLANAQASTPSIHTQSSIQSDRPMQSQSQSALPYSPPSANSTSKDPRRFSFPSFAFLRADTRQNKTRTIPPPLQTQTTFTVSKATKKKSKASRALSIFMLGSAASSEKRAKESAAIVRSVIIGGHNTPPELRSNKAKPVSKFDIARAKSQLLDPKMAAKVITQLRALPAHLDDAAMNSNVPIHAVCLDMPDKDVYEQHFAQLQSIATAPLSAVSTALAGIHLIDLLTAPDMGFGAPVTAQGLFAGSVPTAETVVEGIEQITPQLMALGYATDWWGFEICLPPPTIAQLEAAESPGTMLLNLLTAISILNEGVREILPFIRYIAQFVQTEWSMIKRADEGKGVVCTATWLLPVALVPCAWDFPDLPPPHTEMGPAGQSTPTSPSVKRFSATLTTPKPSTEVPNGPPRSSSAYSAETRDEEESRPIISSEPPVLPELVVSSPGSIDGAPRESIDGEAHNAYGKVKHDGAATAY